MLYNPDFLQQIILPWFVLSVFESWSFQIGMCLNHIVLMSFGSEGNEAVFFFFFGNVTSASNGSQKSLGMRESKCIGYPKIVYF